MFQLSLTEIYGFVTFLVAQAAVVVGLIIKVRSSNAEIKKLSAENKKVETETGLTLSETLKNNIQTLHDIEAQLDEEIKAKVRLQASYDDKVEEYKQLFVKKQISDIENTHLQDQVAQLTQRVSGMDSDLRTSREQAQTYLKALTNKETVINRLDSTVRALRADLTDAIEKLSGRVGRVERDTGRLEPKQSG